MRGDKPIKHKPGSQNVSFCQDTFLMSLMSCHYMSDVLLLNDLISKIHF